MDCRPPFEKILVHLIDEIAEPPQVDEASVQRSSLGQADKPVDRDDYLDELRLYVKYLLFDLDATRRENLYLKKLLEKREF